MKDSRELLLQALDYFKEDIETNYPLIDDKGFQDPIVEMMQDAGHTTVIDLREYDDGVISDSSYGYDLLAENLQHTNIEALYLPNNVHFDQISALLNSFKDNDKINRFGFGDNVEFDWQHKNSADPDDWAAINSLIAIIPETAIKSLYLDLTSNFCTPEIIQNLFNLLNANEKLTELDLKISSQFTEKNHLEIEGMPIAAILDAITDNQNLENLHISIQQRERHRNLGSGISVSKHIKTAWPSQVLGNIQDSLIQNQRLDSVSFGGGDVDDNFADMLIDVIAQRENFLDVKLAKDVSVSQEKRVEIKQAMVSKLVDNLFNKWSDYEDQELIAALKMLKKKRFNFDSTFPEQDGYSLLHMATYQGNIPVFDWLVENNANPNIFSPSDGSNIAHIAAAQSQMEMLQLISDRYPNLLHESDKAEKKPLHHAQTDEVTSYLIDQGVDDSDLFNQNFVENLTRQSRLNSLRKVLSRGLEVDDKLREYAEDQEDIKLVLKEFSDKHQLLLTSAVSGDVDAIQSVFRDGFKIKFSGDAKLAKTLLESASTNKQYEVLALLMSQDTRSDLEHQRYLADFTRDEKIKVSLLQEKYLSSPTAAPIDYLMSKLTLRGLSEPDHQKFSAEFREFFFSDISTNNFLMPILEVAKLDPNLKLTMDLSKSDIAHIYTSAAAETRGNTVLQQSEIYVAAGNRNLKEIVGTTIHELCHQACYLIWQNNAIPYSEADEPAQKFFANIIEELTELHKSKTKLPLTIIEALDYDKDKKSKELIVRVAQTMVTQEDIQDFESITPLRKLTDYYKEEFISKSREHVERHSEEIRNRKISELQEEVTPNVEIQPNLDEPSASLKIQSAYRGLRVRKIYEEFKSEDRAIELAEATLRNSGYETTVEILQKERAVKKSKWADKINQVNKSHDRIV